MLPASVLTVSPDEPSAGDLIVNPRTGGREVRLVYSYRGHRYALALVGFGDKDFTSCSGDELGSPWLSVGNWRLEVDAESAFVGMPEAGDCFMDRDGLGFVGIRNGAELFVSASGHMRQGTPDFARLVAFKRWRVVVDLPAPGEVWALAASPEPLLPMPVIG